jgi:hypothetical protein
VCCDGGGGLGYLRQYCATVGGVMGHDYKCCMCVCGQEMDRERKSRVVIRKVVMNDPLHVSVQGACTKWNVSRTLLT